MVEDDTLSLYPFDTRAAYRTTTSPVVLVLRDRIFLFVCAYKLTNLIIQYGIIYEWIARFCGFTLVEFS